MENLRRTIAELQEKAEKAEPVLRLGSPDKLESLVTRNVSVVGRALVGFAICVPAIGSCGCTVMLAVSIALSECWGLEVCVGEIGKCARKL